MTVDRKEEKEKKKEKEKDKKEEKEKDKKEEGWDAGMLSSLEEASKLSYESVESFIN